MFRIVSACDDIKAKEDEEKHGAILPSRGDYHS